MSFVITPYSLISGGGAIIACIVAMIAFTRRTVPGGKSLAALMISVAIWSGGAAFEYATIGIPAKVFWSKLEYVGVLSCSVFFLLFAIEYINYSQLLSPRNIIIVFFVPLVCLGLAFTNEYHHLIWTNFSPSPAGNNLLIYGHGIGFWIGVIGYSYLIMLVATILLIRGSLQLSIAYRSQVILVIIAAMAPWGVNFIYITGLIPEPGLELTPLVMLFSGIILSFAIFQFHLLDLVPIARHALIETMNEGMLVLDLQNRIVDKNPAAQKLLGENTIITIGSYAGDVFSNWSHLKSLFTQNNPELRSEITINITGEYLEINLSPVHDRQGKLTGQFVILRDVTEKKRNEEKLHLANENLRFQLTENQILQANLQERAIRDSLTGLFNRRYLDETLERELSRAKRENYQISVILIDIDRFKLLNDTYGHKAGDQVLKTLGEFLITGVRQGDIVCRYGGEEFLIIMPGVHLSDAENRAKSLCNNFSALAIKFDEFELGATISIGVAIFPQHGNTSDEIIHAADSAMYAAKQAGRNTVRTK